MNLSLDRVTFSYASGPPVLREVSVDAAQGRLLLLAGHNGAGKSTLLKLLNGILRPGAGTVRIDGLDIKEKQTAELAGLVSVTFQNPSHQIFASTVLQETAFGARNLKKKDPLSLARRALELFRLSAFLHHHPYDLSGAHRKLLTLASAVATDAPILAFDEPSVHLSHPERLVLAAATQQLIFEGKTLIIVSHDLEFFLPFAAQIVILEHGSVSFQGSSSACISQAPRFRSAGVRLPLSVRLRPHVGLDPVRSILPSQEVL